MKKSITIRDVTVDDIIEVLDDWQKGAVTPLEVHDWAERIYDTGSGQSDYPQEKDNPRTLLVYIIESLELMLIEPVVVTDIPHLREPLLMSRTDLAGTWLAYNAYWDKIDFVERLRAIEQCMERMPERYPNRLSWYNDPHYPASS